VTWIDKPTADGAWWQRRFDEEPRVVVVKGEHYLVPGSISSFPIDANPAKWQRVNPAITVRAAPVIGSMHIDTSEHDRPFDRGIDRPLESGALSR
jgi:hypothetical protein